MEIKTFWTIVIKGIGLWLLMNCASIIPQFVSSYMIFDTNLEWDDLLIISGINVAVLIVYILFIRLFLFRTNWLIKILKLDKNFPQDKIDITISYRTVLSIVVIIIGAIIFVDSLPKLVSRMYEFIRQKEVIKNYSETSWLIFHFVKTVIGYLIMTNSRWIVKFIDKEKLGDDKI